MANEYALAIWGLGDLGSSIARGELSLSTVERVVSHPQATAQCARFLREHLPNAEHVSAPSTADAVKTLCRSDDGSVALGSSLAAELYDCYIVATNVEDHPDNETRFVWLTRSGDEPPVAFERRKTSVVFWGGGDASPGWLVRCLSELAFRGINLTRIESRPRKGRLGHYLFHVDMEGRAGEPSVSDALAALGGHCEEVRLLGSYPAA